MEQPKEQIMIDGVDVSGCLFYQSNFEEDYDIRIKHFCSNWHNSCRSSNNSNCYFKQLARKTQECEGLKERLERTEEDLKYQCVDCMNVKSDRYREALEEIEEIAKDYYGDTWANIAIKLDEILNIINKALQNLEVKRRDKNGHI